MIDLLLKRGKEILQKKLNFFAARSPGEPNNPLWNWWAAVVKHQSAQPPFLNSLCNNISLWFIHLAEGSIIRLLLHIDYQASLCSKMNMKMNSFYLALNFSVA